MTMAPAFILAAFSTFVCLLLALLLIMSQVVTCVDLRGSGNTSAGASSRTSQVSQVEWSALLDLKARMTKSNTSEYALLQLANWDEGNLENICELWAGVICTPLGDHIAGINLAGFGLAGSLSPLLGNLTFLSILDLSSNHFFGGIPPQLSACSSLTLLDLHNNSLTGPIPPSLGSLASLHTLELCSNNLSGSIPPPLFTNCTSLVRLSLCLNALNGSIPTSWHLPQLQSLNLASNHLTGHVPPSIGNRSNQLVSLNLAFNNLSGPIPTESGQLALLSQLFLQGNFLNGAVPVALGNCTSLHLLHLDSNYLSGPIPTELGHLALLSELSLGGNNLTGSIPASLGNCTRLVLLILEYSSFALSGPIPTELGHLPLLSELYLGGNNLNGTIPQALGNCTELRHLLLHENQLSGSVPSRIMNLKRLWILDLSRNRLVDFERPLSLGNNTSLIDLRIGSNLFGGPIPSELGQMHGLQVLDLGDNHFTGMIPWESLCNCTSLYALLLHDNHLTGNLSGELQRLSELEDLFLRNNQLQGSIPDLQNLHLIKMDLSFNQLNGSLPDSLATVLNHAIYVNFSHNSFSGILPPWLGELMALQEIDISANHISGTIPENLGHWKELTYLLLSGNNLVGEIPPCLGNISSLIAMDLSKNSLTGTLPSTLQDLPRILFFNVSFNNLKGPIPVFGFFRYLDASSFEGNPGLCGGPLIHKPCMLSHHQVRLGWKKSILIALASLLVVIVVITAIVSFHRERRHAKSQGAGDEDKILKNLVEVRRFTAIGLSESTQNYSERNMLGEGALGVVYKGVLPSGEVVAIKKLRDIPRARDALLQEVCIMSKIRHRNLVRILGYVLNLEVHALVLEFMPNGNLEQYLQQCKASSKLSLITILKIAQGVANGLTYLHHEYDVPSIIHGDVKPNNILLDSEFEARLADFGLAKLARSDNSEVSLSSNIKGSIGYMAPEFAYGAKITTKVDTYSFGVVVLEMVTGIGPTDDEVLHGATLHEWVEQKLMVRRQGSAAPSVDEIVHASSLLLGASASDELTVHELLQVGMACTQVVAERRPTMQKVKGFLDSQLAIYLR